MHVEAPAKTFPESWHMTLPGRDILNAAHA